MAHRKSYQWEPETSEEEPQRKSRSQKKRESTALQNLGEEIAALPMRVIADFPCSARRFPGPPEDPEPRCPPQTAPVYWPAHARTRRHGSSRGSARALP